MTIHDIAMPKLQGYARKTGRPGIRNKLLILYTVECSRSVCHKVAQQLAQLGDIDCIGNEACAANEVIYRQLASFVTHPNVGAVLVIGMGCEEADGKRLYEIAVEAGRYAEIMDVQSCGGTAKSVQVGVALAMKLLEKLNKLQKTDISFADLCFGIECGASDYTSLIAANPLMGEFIDQVIFFGGAGVVGEITEMVGQRDTIVRRAADSNVARDLAMTYDKMINFCKATERFSISHGNFKGGLSTIEEKSAGALVKSGSTPIQGVLKLGQTIPGRGMWILDELPDFVPSADVFRGGDASSMMNLISAGCQMVFLTTGRGHTGGTPVSPTFKITGNARTFVHMNDDLDFDASVRIGTDGVQACELQQLLEQVVCVINGKETCAERHGASFVSLSFNNQAAENVIDHLYY